MLVGEVADTKADLLSIGQDRETDFEERAQEDRAARMLAQLGVHEQRQIEEIDAALRRIAEGTYGRCEVTAQRVNVVQIQALGIYKNAKKTNALFIFVKMGTAVKTKYSST